MAIDLEAIKKKLAALNKTNEKGSGLSSVQLWKPTVGEHKIRALPWPDALPGEPIKERLFYRVGEGKNGKSFLAPSQFGKEDPIEKMRKALFETKKPEDKAIAKTLFPRPYGYLPIIDRGNESAGIQLWKFPKTLNLRLLGFFIDEDCGDFLDPQSGHDLKVTVTQVQGKDFPDTTVDFRPKSTPLSTDPKQAEAWLKSIPELDDLHPYAFKTTDQINAIVNAWLSGDDTSSSAETSRGSEPEDKVESVAKELSAKKVEKPVKPAKTKPKDDDDDDDIPTGSSSSVDLDAAFADLEND